MTTVLVCASPGVEEDLCGTLFWRDDLERYVTASAGEAQVLALATEPHVAVVDLALRGSRDLITSLRAQPLPHPVSIVVLFDAGQSPPDGEIASIGDAALPLPSSPAWDLRLVEVLSVPTRKQARFDVRFDITAAQRVKPSPHRALVVNISAGGLLVECSGLGLQPGDDVSLNLPLPGLQSVEGRARVVRQPLEDRVGLRFEAFAGNGDAAIRHYLSTLASGTPGAEF